VTKQCFADRGLIGDGGHIVARFNRADDTVGHFIAKFHVTDGNKAADRNSTFVIRFCNDFYIFQLIFQSKNTSFYDCLFIFGFIIFAVFGKVAKTACNTNLFRDFCTAGSFQFIELFDQVVVAFLGHNDFVSHDACSSQRPMVAWSTKAAVLFNGLFWMYKHPINKIPFMQSFSVFGVTFVIIVVL